MAENNSIEFAGSRLSDVLLRIYVAGAVAFFAFAAFLQWRSDPGRITLILVGINEAVTAVIIVCSRRARRKDWRPLSVLASFIAMSFFLALDLAPAKHVLPEAAGVGLQIMGLLFQLYAKLSLGRSFGVLPATRSLVTHGAYRWLRHPIYFGYLIAHVGFLFSNFSFQNLSVLLVLYAAQVLRIRREEEVLMTLPGYSSYRNKVRYRLIPGLY